MLPKRLLALLSTLGLAGILIVFLTRWTLGLSSASDPAAPGPSLALAAQDGIREVASPNISFITSDSATCSRPNPGSGVCYIQWQYLNVTAASGSTIISMTVSIDNQMRAYHTGFFQGSMTIPHGMTGPGYKVTCGYPQGEVDLGNSYSYIVRARETSGLAATNYGSVTCPADVVRVYLPMVRK